MYSWYFMDRKTFSLSVNSHSALIGETDVNALRPPKPLKSMRVLGDERWFLEEIQQFFFLYTAEQAIN